MILHDGIRCQLWINNAYRRSHHWSLRTPPCLLSESTLTPLTPSAKHFIVHVETFLLPSIGSVINKSFPYTWILQLLIHIITPHPVLVHAHGGVNGSTQPLAFRTSDDWTQQGPLWPVCVRGDFIQMNNINKAQRALSMLSTCNTEYTTTQLHCMYWLKSW